LFASAAAADQTGIATLAAAIRGAGEWLAAMQRGTRREGEGRTLLVALVSKAVEDVATLAVVDRGIRRHRSALIERLGTLQRRLHDKTLAIAGHHDDYWPGNIFFDGERVTVIDFESFRDGFPLEDVAYFLFRSELLQRRFRVALSDLAGLFFEGYSAGKQPDADALQLFTMTKGLRSLANGMGLDLPMPQRIWTRRTIRGAVLKALRDAV
jgi:Ser/Thr protein kinase RdoA (MazF antagonist)